MIKRFHLQSRLQNYAIYVSHSEQLALPTRFRDNCRPPRPHAGVDISGGNNAARAAQTLFSLRAPSPCRPIQHRVAFSQQNYLGDRKDVEAGVQSDTTHRVTPREHSTLNRKCTLGSCWYRYTFAMPRFSSYISLIPFCNCL